MAGKRLVAGQAPGKGLSVQEPKAREKGRYSREIPPDGKSLLEQQEDQINGRLVDILERKCSKLRVRVETEEQNRQNLEQELEKVKQQLSDRDQQVADLCAAQRDLAEDRHAAMQKGIALEGIQKECHAAQVALREKETELQRLQASSARCEGQWKAQILKLVDESKQVGQSSVDKEQELLRAKEELKRVKEGAQDVLKRYEEESSRRLQLEERCLDLEEKLKSRERLRGDLEQVQQKVKQSQQDKKKAEEVAKHHDERSKEALRREEEAELRCKGLEAEVARLRTLCAERGKRIEQLEASVTPPCPLSARTDDGTERAEQQEWRPPALSRKTTSRPGTAGSSASRPGTAASTGSARSAGAGGCGYAARPTRHSIGGSSSGGGAEPRLPPGAIKRGGSVPVRRPPGAANARTASPADVAGTQSRPAPAESFGSGIARVAMADSRPGSRASSRPSSRGDAEREVLQADPGIDHFVPSSEDESSYEEVITAVAAAP
mmetsp:Transcript_28571/g.51760  ORF Transcript_28571/g.51760 Transcript_28571/m.51760 type:complete len:494 (-) Transcript_28571:54-1535(-)